MIESRTEYDEYVEVKEASHALAISELRTLIDEANARTVAAEKLVALADQRMKALLNGLSQYASGTPDGENELLHSILSGDAEGCHAAERFLLKQAQQAHLTAAYAIGNKLAGL